MADCNFTWLKQPPGQSQTSSLHSFQESAFITQCGMTLVRVDHLSYLTGQHFGPAGQTLSHVGVLPTEQCAVRMCVNVAWWQLSLLCLCNLVPLSRGT